ncbi:MAG: hypothetical protein N2999_05110 [Proteobacteria bacterium]|nr:hypothetical protein [Pseudomonadota bacterium]
MKLQEAYEILRSENPFLKGVNPSSLLWKRALLDFFKSENLSIKLKRALILVSANSEFDEVIRAYFDFLKREENDGIRRFMLECLAENTNELVIDLQFPLLGISERVFDRYLRQLASQNITYAIKEYQKKRPLKAILCINKLKTNCLNDENTFVRMNSAIILRNVGEKKVVPDLEKRLEIEKRLLRENPADIGIPYVIREIERTILSLKERT